MSIEFVNLLLTEADEVDDPSPFWYLGGFPFLRATLLAA